MKKNRKKILLVILAMIALSNCSTPPRPGGVSTSPSMPSGPPPKEAEALWQQAEQAKKAGNIASALSLWERIAKDYPNSSLAAKAFFNAGHTYLEQGQAERALQYFEYLLYHYPQWEGANLAQLDRLRALWMTGKKKQVMKQSLPLWEASSRQPEVRAGLSVLMAEVYRSDGDIPTAFDWLTAGFASVQSPEERKALFQATVDLLKDVDEATLRKLRGKNPQDFMRVFIDFRQAQLDTQEGSADAAREQMRGLLSKNPSHPLVPVIQAALREAPVPGGTVPGALSSETTRAVHPNIVGCLLPLNGPYGQYGRLVLRGLASAIEEWNQRQTGQQVTLIVRDVQSEPEQAVKSFEQLAGNDGALAIIGPLGAKSTKAVSAGASALGVPLLTLAQREEESAESPYVLHIFLDNRELVRALVRYCREKLGYTRFAALYPDDRYGQRLAKIFAEVVKEQEGSLLASIPYKEKSTDFREPIQKLLTVAKQNIPPAGVDATPFEALFIPDQVQTVSLVAPQLPYNNVVGATLLGTNLWGEAPLVQAGGAYVEQAIFATPFYAESRSPKARAFNEKYQDLYQTTPAYLEAQAYDAMMLFLEARSTLRSIDRVSFLQSLLRVRNYQGVAGVYSFTPEGGLSRDYLLLQVLNGQLVQLTR